MTHGISVLSMRVHGLIGGRVVIGGGVSGSVSAGVGETEGNTAWVTEQTSLTGGNAVDISVGGHTQIDGAVVAQINSDGTDGGNLTIDTGTLGVSDIEDNDSYTSFDVGVNIGFSAGGDSDSGQQSQGPDPVGASQGEISSWGVNGNYSDVDREQINRGTIGEGDIVVRDGEVPTDLNRDIDQAQELTKDDSTDVDLYVTDTGLDALKNPIKTFNSWKENLGNYVANTRSTARSLDRTVDLAGDILGSVLKGEGIEGAKNDAVNSTLIWQWVEYRSEDFAVVLNAENFSPEEVQAALQVLAQERAALTGEDEATVLLALSQAYRDKSSVAAAGAASGEENLAVLLLGEEGTSISDATDIARTLGEELSHATGTCGSDEDCAGQQANDFADAFEDELNRQGIDDQQDAQADADYVADNSQDGGLLDQNTDRLAEIPVGELDYRYIDSIDAANFLTYIEIQKRSGKIPDGIDAYQLLTLYAALSENVGNLDNLDQEIDALDPAALGVTPENLEFFKGIDKDVTRRVLSTDLNDELCGADGSLVCGIAAGIADGLHRPESPLDLAIDATIGRLAEGAAGAGVDAVRGWLKSDTLDDVVTILDDVKVDAPDGNSGGRVDADSGGGGGADNTIATTTPVKKDFSAVNHGPLGNPNDSTSFASTFRSGNYTDRALTQDTVLYRVIPDDGNPSGAYWTATPPKGPLQSVIDSALDQNWGNTATRVVKANVPAGTRIFEGVAAPQRGLVGGGNQIVFDRNTNPFNPDWIIAND